MHITHLKTKLALTAGYLGILAVLYKLQVPCIFVRFLGIPCPGCGMTRAMLAAVQLRLGEAFSYHPMFWSVPVLYLYILFDKGIFPKKRQNYILLAGIGIGFLASWLWKLG